ncbi:acyltransferase family protein [Halalkalibacter okhensis]|uniref:Acyltransferase n=1 Tax=Halalkalibacter okhensis TaxID=333138 RepID=A0A0B0IGC6_9BACI|nr:acyltransferase family protein [Halalkalibacter okhensis]KHF39129.1 acyltransferase [Halalkalibacter okhensis]
MTDLRAPEKRFRPEIEGVRAVAALLVAIYHIWLGSVSGGVDVFFIVSGYLITTTLLSKMEREGKVNILEYFLGLVRRLFPIAFAVLFVSTLLSILLMPQTQWKQIISEIFASVSYFQNWQLAFSSVDYLAQNNEASPFQHFWALSIQGQFYLTWPLIILLAYALAIKVFKTPIRKTLLAVLSVIFVASISYSIYMTAVNQPWAYFDTFARAWEFSLGGMLALLIPYLAFTKSVSLVLGWVGLAIISFTGLLLPVSTVFPGYAALLPTSGVILVIIAAETGNRFGVEKLLGSKPFLYFGSISYGFYLWHWPLLIFYFAYFRTDSVTVLGGLAILLITFVLSVISVKFVEAPIRTINVRQSKMLLASRLVPLILPVIFVTASWGLYVNHTQASLFEPDLVEDYPGARAILDNVLPTQDIDPIPAPVHAKDHLPAFYEDSDCFSHFNDPKVATCSLGETENPDYTIALVGGSHSGHWFPALEEMSERLNLQIDVYNKDACRFSDEDFNGKLHESCMVWNEDIIEPLTSDPPDLVFTTANVNRGDTVPQGYINQWKKLEGITHVFAVRDNPRMQKDTPFCVEAEEDPLSCSVPREEALSEAIPWENTDGIPDNVTFADLSDYFCDDTTCHAVIGNVIVYRDLHHITTLYSQTLGPVLEEYIADKLENLES